MTTKSEVPTGNILNDFIGGARKAIDIALYVQVPNFVMAFTLIHIIQLSGFAGFLGKTLGPLLAVFSLPGEAAVPLAVAWLSTAGGVGATAALIQNGTIQPTHSAILLPMMMTLGGQLQMLGRVLNVTKPPKRYYKVIFVIGLVNTIVTGLIMSLLVKNL